MSDNKIPVRYLGYVKKGDTTKRELVISLLGPYLVEKDKVNFQFDSGTAACTINFNGLDELENIEVFGMDKLHALTLAVDVDPYLKSLTDKYDFFWADGSPYFEE